MPNRLSVCRTTVIAALIALATVATASAQSWIASPSMNAMRAADLENNLLRLPDGRLIITTGDTRAEIYDPATSQWSLTSENPAGYPAGTTMTVMADGRVMFAGGYPPVEKSAQIYSPATDTWTSGGTMNRGRTFASAVTMPDGRVMVIGGFDMNLGVNNNNADVYNPATNTWTLAAAPAGAGDTVMAIVTNDGRILFAGGRDGGRSSIFDPASNSWFATTGFPSEIRRYAELTNLADGRVLMTGGNYQDWERSTYFDTAWIFTPATKAWTQVASMAAARGNHRAVRLLDGRVLVAGGGGGGENFNVYTAMNTVEIYDPALNVWTPAASLSIGRRSPGMAALDDGSVVIAGGWNGPESRWTDNTVERFMFDPNALPPTAEAGADQVFNVCLGCNATVTLSAAGSVGRNNLALTYRWSEGGATLATSTDPTRSVTVSLGAGTHTILLEVSDGRASASDVTHVTITQPAPMAPTANAGPDQTLNACFQCGAQVSLDGTASFGNNGLPLTYTWREGTTVLGTGASPSVGLPNPGVHTIELTVSDGFSSATDTVVITINEPIAPTVTAGPDQTLVVCFNCSTPVTLTAAGSAGHNSLPLTYTWKEGATTLATTTATSVVVTLGPGPHTITLTATDGKASASDTLVVTVSATLLTPPTANAGPDQTKLGCPSCLTPVTLDASASVGGNGLPLTYTWMEGATVLGTTADPVKTLAVSLGVGVHVITLAVNDTKSGASDTVTINVVDQAVDLGSQVAALQQQLAAMTAQRDGLAASLQTASSELATANDALSTANLTITDRNATIGQLQDQLAAATATNAGNTTVISQLQDQLGSANATIAARDAQVVDLTAQIDAAAALLLQRNATIASLTADLTVASQTIADKHAQIVQLQADGAAATQIIAERNATIASQLTTIANRDTTIVAMTADLTAAGQTIADKHAQIVQLQADGAAAAQTIAERNATIASQLTSIANRDVTIANQSVTIAQRDATIASHAATLAQRDATIAGQTATIAQRDQAISALTAQVTSLQAQVASLQAQLATALTATASLTTNFQQVFADPAFNIAGSTPAQQVQTLVTAIGTLNNGQKQALYKSLGGSKK